MRKSVLVAGMLAALSGCGPDYSPNTYNSAAVQQANKVDRGIVIGARQVDVESGGAIGAATGAAAGGAVGSQAPGGSVSQALGAVSGALIGGLVGSGAEKAAANTKAWEYVVRKANGELVSVTQKDESPLPIGQKVLVIAGPQARIVGDYTVDPADAAAAAAAAAATPATAAPKPQEAPAVPPAVTETPLSPSAAPVIQQAVPQTPLSQAVLSQTPLPASGPVNLTPALPKTAPNPAPQAGAISSAIAPVPAATSPIPVPSPPAAATQVPAAVTAP